MGLIDYLKIQSSNGMGNDNRVFIIPYDDIDTVTFDNDDTVTEITLHSNKEWTRLEADINSVIYSSSGDQSITYFSDQDLIIDFTGKSEETEKTINSIKDEINEGLVIIRLDGNHKGWISGISIPRDSYINMPWNEVSDNFSSGETIEDTEEGNKYSLTFKRSSGVKEYLLHSDIVNAFWDWKVA